MTASEPQTSSHPGRLSAGVILLLLGGVWLLDAVGVDIPWTALLPLALILIGLALIVTARSGGHGGLVALGVVLSVILAVATSVDRVMDVDVATGGVGDRNEAPATVADLQPGYQMGVGSLTVDLRDVDFPSGSTELSVDVGVGELIVLVPPDVAVEMEAEVLIGEVRVEGRARSGFGVDLQETLPAEEPSDKTLVLVIDLGVGEVEVRR